VAGAIGLSTDAAPEPRDEGRPRAAAGARPRAVALGTFDGVHLGHRRVIEAALADAPALMPTVSPFWPHPRIVLGNEVDC
jgi:FAD synthase